MTWRNNSHFLQESRVCIPVPLYHCFGMVLGSLTNITCGTTTVFPSGSFDAKAALQAVHDHRSGSLLLSLIIALHLFTHFVRNENGVHCVRGARCRCTSLYGTPTMFIDMLAVPDHEKYDLTSLHTGTQLSPFTTLYVT